MIFRESPLKGSYIVELKPYADERGLFVRTFCKNEFREIGHEAEFVQFNHSVTLKKGTVRGMHYQLPPFSEIKLIRCVRGGVCDVIIDVRHGSPSFLKFFSIELTEQNMLSLYIPGGFAHGFQTLEDNSQLIYHHTAYYEPGHEAGIRYDDPAVAISWPLPVTVVTLKDMSHPLVGKNFDGIRV